MYIRNFDWDIKNETHIWEHGVGALEVEEVFLDKPIYQRSKKGMYVAFGISSEGRYLFVVFHKREKGVIRVITARDMTPREKRSYRKRR